ncbi:hypothetical protein EJ03DRAFT_324586 [Teratosphaeria nubilosa]|uniref:Uncharacterized protein n=1 Tax=Teratosphaeria nubilosa TaxID=161662 RepID=A0A6G1LI58_9PEZI|nr:hypothetical protein EJ03DRAFT_324586 [Teratosphaeria nubilosa]
MRSVSLLPGCTAPRLQGLAGCEFYAIDRKLIEFGRPPRDRRFASSIAFPGVMGRADLREHQIALLVLVRSHSTRGAWYLYHTGSVNNAESLEP